jgi:hypothetical protein
MLNMEQVPALIKNQLICLDTIPFEQQSLQWQVRRVSEEAQHEQALLDGAINKVLLVSNFMAWYNKNLIKILQEETTRLAELQGHEKPQFTELLSPEEILEGQGPKEVEDKPTKWSDRKKEEKCKFLFRKISSACHPDRTTDLNLQDFMPIANEAYSDQDLETLEIVWNEVSAYAKAKRTKSSMMDAFKNRLRMLRNEVLSIRTRRENLLKSKKFDMVIAYEQGRMEDAKKIYAQMIEDRISEIKMAIAQVNIHRKVNHMSRYAAGL